MDNTTQELLVAKINILLAKSNDIEALLVALILLTRVVDDGAYQSCLQTATKKDDASSWTTSHGLSRLVAQHLQRVASIDTATKNPIMNDLGDMLTTAIGQDHEIVRSAPDVLESMGVYLDRCRQSSRIEAALFLLWEVLIARIRPNEEETILDNKDDDEDERVLFETTLSKLLNQTSDVTSPKPWKEAIMEILTRSGCRIAPLRLPSFFRPMLDSWSQKTTLDNQIETARVLLNVMARAGESPPPKVIDLILACLVTDADESLRELAWSTVVSVSRNDAWDWCLPKLTVLIRLLAGEWRIQLQHDHQSVESCGMALISAVRYIANLTTSEASLPISMDQVLHVRKSFDESIQTTVEYLVLDNDHGKNIAIVSRVLGTFLSEMDPFEHSVHVGGEADQEAAPISALVTACDKASDETTIVMLVPAVTALLELAQGDQYRVSMLDQYGLLNSTFTEFMAKVFVSRISDDSCIAVACQAIDIWLEVTPLCETSALQKAMITYLEKCIKNSATKDNIGNLSSVMTCYASLQGDAPPHDPKSVTVLQTAYNVCVRYNS